MEVLEISTTVWHSIAVKHPTEGFDVSKHRQVDLEKAPSIVYPISSNL
jgi:hypothetical protein